MRLKFFVAAIALIMSSMPSHAYSRWVCNHGAETMDVRHIVPAALVRISEDSFAIPMERNAINRGIDITNTNPSTFEILSMNETGDVGYGNDQNEIFAEPIDAIGEARMEMVCLGPYIADLISIGGVIAEVDIVINSDETSWHWGNWKSQNVLYGGNMNPLDTVIVHEAGHLLGLAHVATEYNVMGSAWSHMHTNGKEGRVYFGEDAGHGARALYGAQQDPFNDLSVSHWRYFGSDGEYSTHSRTRMFDASGNQLPSAVVNAEPVYSVTPGQTIKAEFTVENNGKTNINDVMFGFYISDNDTISKSDRKVTWASLPVLNPADVLTRTFTITIPSDLTPQTNYWLGIIIDDDNSVTEVTGKNNATYIGFRTN